MIAETTKSARKKKAFDKNCTYCTHNSVSLDGNIMYDACTLHI